MPKWDQISSSLLGRTSQKINRVGNFELFRECYGEYNSFDSLIWMYDFYQFSDSADTLIVCIKLIQ